MPNPTTLLYLFEVCLDCGHEFSPDSSPHDDRCWECAERADTEAVTR